MCHHVPVWQQRSFSSVKMVTCNITLVIVHFPLPYNLIGVLCLTVFAILYIKISYIPDSSSMVCNALFYGIYLHRHLHTNIKTKHVMTEVVVMRFTGLRNDQMELSLVVFLVPSR